MVSLIDFSRKWKELLGLANDLQNQPTSRQVEKTQKEWPRHILTKSEYCDDLFRG